MKKILTLLLFLSLGLTVLSQTADKQKTEVIVIGTIHFPTNNINADTIYQAIQKVQPNLVLIESGKSYFNDNGTFKENTFDENEWVAARAYEKKYPLTKFFPFDIEGRDKIRKQLQINGDNPFIDYLFEKDSLNKLSKIDKSIFDRFLILNKLCDSIYNSSLGTINNSKSDNILHERQFYQYLKLSEIANNIEEIKEIKHTLKSSISLFDYNRRWSDFELRRNFEMTENILNVIKENPNKRLVVLVGFYHRHAILETLRLNQNKFDFIIKEYYE